MSPGFDAALDLPDMSPKWEVVFTMRVRFPFETPETELRNYGDWRILQLAALGSGKDLNDPLIAEFGVHEAELPHEYMEAGFAIELYDPSKEAGG